MKETGGVKHALNNLRPCQHKFLRGSNEVIPFTAFTFWQVAAGRNAGIRVIGAIIIIITYNMASDYYGLGLKPVTRMAHECGAIYKIGWKILIRRSIFEEYLREERKF